MRINRIALMVVTLLAVFAAFAAPANAEIVNVVFLHTGDTEGQLYSFHPTDVAFAKVGISSKPVGGYPKRHIFFADKRANKKIHWVVLDSGGAFGGSLLSFYMQGFVDVEMMNRLKYDAMALGLQEFRFGQSVLKERFEMAQFPFLCANIKVAETGEHFAKPYTIIERGGLKIGVIGLISENAQDFINPRHTEGLVFSDPIETFKAILPEVKTKADVIVALTHQGVDADIRLAAEVPEISVIIGGMSKTELEVPMRVGDTFIVHAGKWGEKVGMFKVTFEGDSTDGWHIRYFDETLVPMDGRYADNTDILKLLNKYTSDLESKLGVVITELPEEMGNLRVKATETEIGNFAADVAREYAGADAALITASSIRGPLPKGPITAGDVYRAFPGDDILVSYELKGFELWQLLSQGASQIGTNGFPSVSNIEFGIYDAKAYEIAVKGMNLVPDATYTVVTTDFVADGGDGYGVLIGRKPMLYTGITLREAVEKHLKEHTGVTSEVEGRIYFLAEPPEDEDIGPFEYYVPPYEEEAIEEDSDGEVGSEETENGGEMILPDNGIANLEELTTTPGTDFSSGGQPPMLTENYVGVAEITEDGLHYAFAVVPREEMGSKFLEFRMDVTNVGEINRLINFQTHQHVDFSIKEGSRIAWNYGFWRYWPNIVDSFTLEPGKSVTYIANWDGIENSGTIAARKLYRFEAQFLATSGSTLGFTSLLEWSGSAEGGESGLSE